MKIVSLVAENVKRLRAIHIKADGAPLVIIGGENGQGKSSAIDSIWYALGGKDALPPKPVRDGEQEATITLDLGEYVVTRTITVDGKTTLKLTGKDGGRYNSPHTILDAMVGNLSFDPLAFSRMHSRDQLDTLNKLVGLDFSVIDRQKQAKTEERLLVGREVKQLQGQLQGIPGPSPSVKEEISVADLSKQLNEARQTNASRSRAADEALKAANTLAEWGARVVELTKELADAKEQTGKWKVITEQATQKAEAMPSADEQAIITQMSQTEAYNRKVRENKEHARVSATLKVKQDAYQKLTTEIESIDGQKAVQLAGAKFPVPGLSFDETGVLVNGVPFEQASGAEQLRISVAMGLALNPTLKVLLVRDGSLLDEKSLAMVAEMAGAAGGQVWLERVGNKDEKAIIIEDGMVAGVAHVDI